MAYFTEGDANTLKSLSESNKAKKSKVQILQMAVAKTRPFTVLVEGNIGCGKTTFLQHFAKVRKTFFKIDEILCNEYPWKHLKKVMKICQK